MVLQSARCLRPTRLSKRVHTVSSAWFTQFLPLPPRNDLRSRGVEHGFFWSLGDVGHAGKVSASHNASHGSANLVPQMRVPHSGAYRCRPSSSDLGRYCRCRADDAAESLFGADRRTYLCVQCLDSGRGHRGGAENHGESFLRPDLHSALSNRAAILEHIFGVLCFESASHPNCDPGDLDQDAFLDPCPNTVSSERAQIRCVPQNQGGPDIVVACVCSDAEVKADEHSMSPISRCTPFNPAVNTT